MQPIVFILLIMSFSTHAQRVRENIKQQTSIDSSREEASESPKKQKKAVLKPSNDKVRKQ